VNCLQLQVLNCLNCEGGGGKLQRYLIIIYRSAWNGIWIDFYVKQFCWEQTGTLQKYVIVDNISKNFYSL
jgi:hypothetical protein